MAKTKECPVCKNTIPAKACRCRHCGKWFGGRVLILILEIIIIAGLFIAIVAPGYAKEHLPWFYSIVQSFKNILGAFG